MGHPSRPIRRLACAAATLALALPPATAQLDTPRWPDLTQPTRPQGGGERDAALVVGIEDYAFVDDVPGARNNAIAWYRHLTSARGVPASAAKLLSDHDASLERIRHFAEQAALRVQSGGTLWFVFIGHGAPLADGSDGVLVGMDAQRSASSLRARSLTQRALLDVLEQGPQAHSVLVIDTCFSGRSHSGSELVPGLQPLGLAPPLPSPPDRTVLISAAGRNQYAGPLRGAAQPAFSYLLLGALRGWGDGNDDGVVSASEAVAYSRKALLSTLVDRTQEPQLIPESAAITLARDATEDGPDLTDLVAHFARRPFGAGFGNIPVPPPVEEPLDPIPELPEISFRQLDTGFLDLFSKARETELREAATAHEKARVWRAVENYGGDNPWKTEASARALEWERTHQAQLQRRTRLREVYKLWVADTDKLERVLAYPDHTVSPEQKTAYQEEFQRVYDPWLEDLRRLDSGEVKSIGMRMAWIPAGSFEMGSPSSEPGRGSDERRHQVTLTQDYLMAETEVTQRQWRAVMGSDPSHFDGGGDLPVESVSWHEAIEFCNELSKREGLKPAYRVEDDEIIWETGADGYRLPTEAEWEYACRAGARTSFWAGDSIPELEGAGWYSSNSGERTHPVGQKGPNRWGLLDVHGNVWEWCWDRAAAYPFEPATDPAGPVPGSHRIVRGGSWGNLASYCRSAARSNCHQDTRYPHLGLRFVRSMR